MSELEIETRSDLGWGPTAAGYANVRVGLAVHNDGGTPLGLAVKSHSACIAKWKWNRTFHMQNPRNWADIGYAWGMCQHGIAFEGRGFDRQQAAQPGGNTTHQSVYFFIGGNEGPTKEAIEGFKKLRAYLRSRGVGSQIRPHSSFVSTSCPGDTLRTLISNGVLGASVDTPVVDQPVTGGGGGSSSNVPHQGMTSVRDYLGQQKGVNYRRFLAGVSGRIAEDGVWGPETYGGVRELQDKVGADVDGKWGNETESKYNDYTAKHKGSSGGGGTVSRKIKVDGKFGPETKKALQRYLGVKADGIIGRITVKALQKRLGVKQDGVWGSKTTKALQRKLNGGGF